MKIIKGFPTQTKDITGQVICVGDICRYNKPTVYLTFEVVFEDNAFRKKYAGWNKKLFRPILRCTKFENIQEVIIEIEAIQPL